MQAEGLRAAFTLALVHQRRDQQSITAVALDGLGQRFYLGLSQVSFPLLPLQGYNVLLIFICAEQYLPLPLGCAVGSISAAHTFDT